MNRRIPEDVLIEALSTGDLVPESPARAAVLPRPEGAPRMASEAKPHPIALGDSEGTLLEVAVGPHHPSTHGVFRMDVVLDGERVVRLKPVFGYLHRNHEKLGEGGHIWRRCRTRIGSITSVR